LCEEKQAGKVQRKHITPLVTVADAPGEVATGQPPITETMVTRIKLIARTKQRIGRMARRSL
jgi:hypothetical protein